MWYAKNEENKTYFKSSDLLQTQKFARIYNATHKIPTTQVKINDFNQFFGLWMCDNKWDISHHTKQSIFNEKFITPFNKKFQKQHEKYRKTKHDKLVKLAKKYHLWSYNEKGRKADSFDY